MNNAIIVFTGTSIDLKSGKKILGDLALFFPPIKRGDISEITRKYGQPGVIVIIDGFYYNNLSVSLTEIREAIKLGWKFYGASSMGALRAVEANIIGMKGFGKVYRWLKLFNVCDDDEVAQVVNPQTCQPLSLSMIEIRYIVRHLRLNKLITRQLSTVILNKMKALYFPERTEPNLIRLLKENSFLSSEFININCKKIIQLNNIKNMDAVMLLEKIKKKYLYECETL